LSVNLGFSVGPALGGFLATYSFKSLFWVDGATSIAAGVVLLARFRDSARKEQPTATHLQLPSLALFDPRLLYFLLALLPVLVTFFQHQGAMSLYMVRELHLSEAAYGLMFTINTLIIVLAEVRTNAAMAHWPHRRALALGAMLLGVGFGGLAFAHSVSAIIVTVVIWTAGEIVFLPTLSAYVSELAPRGRAGEYMGYYLMAFGIAFAVAPWLGTEVMERFGSKTLWLASLAFGLISACLLLRIAGAEAAKRIAEGTHLGAPVE
jgi:MFS family permease